MQSLGQLDHRMGHVILLQKINRCRRTTMTHAALKVRIAGHGMDLQTPWHGANENV